MDTDADTLAVSLDTSLNTILSGLRGERDEARLEAAALHAETVQLRERLGEAQGHVDDARVERDRWREMAERLAQREAKQPSEPQPRPSFLVRLLSRGRPRPA